jgi:hypothetical protein
VLEQRPQQIRVFRGEIQVAVGQPVQVLDRVLDLGFGK